MPEGDSAVENTMTGTAAVRPNEPTILKSSVGVSDISKRENACE